MAAGEPIDAGELGEDAGEEEVPVEGEAAEEANVPEPTDETTERLINEQVMDAALLILL